MTTEDFLKKMREIFHDRDTERAHSLGDDLLVRFILEREPADDNVLVAIALYCDSPKWYS